MYTMKCFSMGLVIRGVSTECYHNIIYIVSSQLNNPTRVSNICNLSFHVNEYHTSEREVFPLFFFSFFLFKFFLMDDLLIIYMMGKT